MLTCRTLAAFSLCPTALRPCLVLVLLCLCCAALGLEPTHQNIAYNDDHPSQCLDVYLPGSGSPVPAVVWIHGGGWQAGSKAQVPKWLLALAEQGTAAVVSVEYRFIKVARHPAQVNDARRSIQFIRSRAEKWSIDPERIAVAGGSAGGHLAAYVALSDDLADAESADRVLKQSSRVCCGISFAGPTDWRLLGEIEHNHPAYRMLIGYPPQTPAAALSPAKLKSVSPIFRASNDDPPLLMFHGDKDKIVPVEHARALHKKLKSLDRDCELIEIAGGGHGVAGASDELFTPASLFLKTHLFAPIETR